MKFERHINKERDSEIISLFVATFTASEGPDEGRAIGDLVSELITLDECRIYIAQTDAKIVGAVAFTPLKFPNDDRVVQMLSPMAVQTERHGQGIGQSLIRYALTDLQQTGTQIVVTYGDPAFYGKVGFASATTDIVPAPYPLSMPIGWLAQSLDGGQIRPFADKPHCAAPFMSPNLW